MGGEGGGGHYGADDKGMVSLLRRAGLFAPALCCAGIPVNRTFESSVLTLIHYHH